MKQKIFKITSFFASLIPVNILVNIAGIKTIYPFYHIVSNHPPIHLKHLYPVRSIKQFKKDLDFLQKHFTASEFPADNEKQSFVLSFDDGLSEVYNTIAPILQKRKIPALFFINSAFTDNKDLFYKYKISLILEKLNQANTDENIYDILNCKTKKECIQKLISFSFNEDELINSIADKLNIDFRNYLENNKPYLTTEQIKELIPQGFKIGAHSVHHPLFSEINDDEQISQVKECIKYLQVNFILRHLLFAFPFTDDGVKEAFFKTVFNNKMVDFTFGSAGIKEDSIKNNIQRIPIEKYGLSAKTHIKTELLMYIIKRIFNKHIVKR